jgi:hypothetical protein
VAQSSTPGSSAAVGGRWLYPVLLALQTSGAVLAYWKGLPLYREAVNDPAIYEARTDTRVWSLCAIVLIQAGFWICYRVRPALPRFVRPVLGQVVQFLALLVFTLATSVFGFVFLMQKLATRMPAVGYVLTLMLLFSLFCYRQELQRLGKHLARPRP